MSLFNFNPSSFLGSGAFTLDPSKFNFSNITVPKPVDDPVAIVSDKTPDTEVEILEGAGTVAITQKPEPDPIEQAIKTVVKPTPVETAVKSEVKPTPTSQPEVIIPEMFTPSTPVDLGMNFGVNVGIDTDKLSSLSDLNPQYQDIPSAISDEGKYQDSGDVSIANVGAVGFDSGIADIDTALGDKQAQMFERAADEAVALSSFRNDILSDLGVSRADLFTEEVNGIQITKQEAPEFVSSDYITFLNNLVSSDTAKSYAEQMTEKATDFYSESSEDKKTDYGTLDIVSALGLGGNTFKVPGKYGGYSVYEYNEDSNQYVKTEDKESSAIDAYLPVVADAIQDFFYKGVLTAGLGTLVGSTETIQNIKQANDVVKAVENDNVLGAVAGALDLAGLPSPTDYVEGFIEDSLSETELGDIGNTVANWAFNNTDHIAEATVKFFDTAIKGGDLGDATKDAVVEYIKDGGGVSDLIPEGDFDFPDIDFEVPEVIEEVAQLIADGASNLNREFIKPTIKTIEEIATDVKDTYKEDIEPLIEKEFDDFKDYYKTEIEPSIEQGIKDVKQELSDFDDTVLQPTKDTIIKTAENIENYYKTEIEPSIEQGIKDVKEELARFDENVLQPIKETTEGVIAAVDEKLNQFDDEVLQPIKDDIVAVANSVDQGLSDFNKDVIKPAMQSIEDRLSAIDMDTSDLEKMIKGLFEMVNFGNVANQAMQRVANRPTFEQVDLTNVELLTPEVVEGFEYDNLSNKLLA